MDAGRTDLYFLRMMPANDAAWSFQLLSVPFSTHDAEERFTDAPQWSSDLHLIHTVEGRGVLHVGRERYESTPDNVLVVPPYRHCRWEKRGTGAWTMLNLHARLDEADGTTLHERSLLPISFTPNDMAAIHARLALIQQLWTGTLLERGVAASDALSIITGYLTAFGRVPAEDLRRDPQDATAARADQAAGRRPVRRSNAGAPGGAQRQPMQPSLPLELRAVAEGLLAAVSLCPGAVDAARHLGQHQADCRSPWLLRHLLFLALVQRPLPDAADTLSPAASRDVEARLAMRDHLSSIAATTAKRDAERRSDAG
jgi:hypothetical protein